MKRAALLILLCPVLAGCGTFMALFGSASLEGINREIAELEASLEFAKTPEEGAEIQQRIESLGEKRDAIEKARDSAGGGVESILYVLGIVLGIPLLGTAAPAVGRLIRGGEKKT